MENIFENKQSVWEVFKTTNLPIVLYGMGDGADKVINQFEKLGIKASAVMASDDFVRGQSFRGFKVQKLSEIEETYDDFIIALCFGSQLDDVMNHIKAVAEKHTLLVPSVPVFGDNIFDKAFVEKYFPLISKADDIFFDVYSKEIYRNLLLFQYTGELKYLFKAETPKDEAFNNILKLNDNEFFADLGACKGDTVEEFLSYVNDYEKIIAFEPNVKNFEKLKIYCTDIKNTEIWNLAVHSKEDVLYFNKKSGRSSAEASEGVPIKANSLDNILQGRKATYVKMDVEGCEANAIEGSIDTLKNYKPKLNLAVYHRSEDIFVIPLLIKAINPDYKIYLRHHPYIPHWDTNIYCM